MITALTLRGGGFTSKIVFKMKWFKDYVDSFRDIKFKKLQRTTDVFSHLWLLWGMILSETAKNGGVIECQPEDWELLFDLIVDQTSEPQLHDMLRELEAVDLIHIDPEGTIRVKNWEKYQSIQDSSVKRVREHRVNKEHEAQITQVIELFNQIVGTRFSVKTQTTRDLISGRLNEGRTIEEMAAVIKHRKKKWGNDPKMKDYIRPSTIFRPGNFDNYLNEISPDILQASSDGTLLKVRNMYGQTSEITQEQFDRAAEGFYSIIE